MKKPAWGGKVAVPGTGKRPCAAARRRNEKADGTKKKQDFLLFEQLTFEEI